MVESIDLYERQNKGEDIPIFAVILFARDTSQNPDQLLGNHVNGVGDTHGLEQVEMFLLGHTLGVQLQIFRPSQAGQPDFCSFFPDDVTSGTPKLLLLAEDDRHYNVITH